MINPNAIAAEIIANCEAYDAGIINRARWDSVQCDLWKRAADFGLASVVMRMVCRGHSSQWCDACDREGATAGFDISGHHTCGQNKAAL